MSMMKRFAEEVAADMGKDGIDEEVLEEAQRRLDAMLGKMLDDPPLAVVEDGKVKFIYPNKS
jgi:hypothetical protein